MAAENVLACLSALSSTASRLEAAIAAPEDTAWLAPSAIRPMLLPASEGGAPA